MINSLNKLWKMLVDRIMTKAAMRKQSGISTNILAKATTALQCGLDGIVEISDTDTGGCNNE